MQGGQHRGAPLIGEAQLDRHEYTLLKVAELLVVADSGKNVLCKESCGLLPRVHLDRSARSVVQN